LVMGAINEEQRARLEEHWELDFALQIAGLGRFRANAHYSRGALEAAFRHIPERIPELEELGHRPAVQQLCELERGLILVTGITGSGKSTTMASMIQHISRQRDGVIITMEDPVEYVFQNARSVVKQREVGSDTKSFICALRHVLRQDPDVVLVGEMRDLETIAAACGRSKWMLPAPALAVGAVAGLLDRFLVALAHGGVPAAIVVNKYDLAEAPPVGAAGEPGAGSGGALHP